MKASTVCGLGAYSLRVLNTKVMKFVKAFYIHPALDARRELGIPVSGAMQDIMIPATRTGS